MLMQSAAWAQQADDASSDVVDEIIVRGQKSLLRMRLEVYKAEDRFYELYNVLNDDDDFDILCRKEAPVGSHIMRRVCKANFERLPDADDAAVLGMGLGAAPGEIVKVKKRALLMEKMEKLVTDNPELLEALTDLDETRKTFEATKSERCGGWPIFCSKPE